MQAVILVGGEGTRLRPLTDALPKPMVPVLNRPFLEHTLARLKGHQVDEAVLALSYLPQVIRAYFGEGEGLGMKLHYAVEHTPLGTAGAVKNAQPHLKGTFAVLNGDIFSDLDLGNMLDFHRRKRARATIALTWVENPSAFGVVETGRGGRVKAFIEKPPPGQATTQWINAGLYLLEPEILEHIPPGAHFMFERGLFPLLVERGVPVFGYPFRGYWMDMGTPEKYLQLNSDLLLSQTTSPLVPWDGGVRLGPKVALPPGVEIVSPCILGDGCRLGRGVRLKGPVVLGPGCRLEERASVEASVLWEGVRVGKGASLRSCVIGSHTTVKDHDRLADCTVANGQVRKAGEAPQSSPSLGMAAGVGMPKTAPRA